MRRSIVLLSVLALLLPVLALGLISSGMGTKVSAEALERMEAALRRGAVECYALEGFYPTDADYLTERYGLPLDGERYFVDYRFLGSNLMPDITVLPMSGEVKGNG